MKLHHKLKKLRKVERKKLHPLIRHVHRKHGISRKTLFYVKEYCADRNVIYVIIKESLYILIITSLISAVGGFGLENLKDKFIVVLPLLIMFPVLNSLIGNYGIIFCSRYSAMMHEGRIQTHPLRCKEVQKLLFHLAIIGIFTAILAAIFSLVFASLRGYTLTPDITSKIILIAVINTIVVSSILVFLSIVVGNYIYRKKEDPNNFLIPVTTSAADLLNIGLLLLFVHLLF